MRYLVDTNVLSELRKGRRADPGVRTWFEAAEGRDLHTSVLVLGEIRRGIESIRRRDASGAAALDQWLVRMHESFGDRVVVIDAAVADQWGALNVPDRVPAVDGLLAATAIVQDMTVVTRNVSDFTRTGAKVENPFSE